MKNQAFITLLKGLEQSLDDYCELNDEGKTAFRMAITALEQPERKKGKWIDKSDGIEDAWNYCSVCGEQAIDLYDFCPKCGADMRDK